MNEFDQMRFDEMRAERDALQAKLDRVETLCKNTNGDWLHPESELPVGCFQQAILDRKGEA